MPVSDTQIQNSFDQDVRPACNSFVALMQKAAQFSASNGDLYAAISGSSWTDQRSDGPPHLAAKTDWYAFNTFVVAFQALIAGTATAQQISDFAAQWPIIKQLCTRDHTGV